MASERWTQVSLGDLIDIRHGYAFDGQYFRDEPPGDILLTPGNFAIGGGFQQGKLKYYDGPVPAGFILDEGDLLVSMTDLSKNGDTLGYPALVPASQDGARYLHNQRLGKVLVRPDTPLDLHFLYFLLRTKAYRGEVLSSATGSTVRHTSPDRIKAFQFLLPPLPEQRAIARILGALDDKIELNRRMNATLQAMAIALFKSWFVDFDPVRAKAESRTPAGMDKVAVALFPDGIEDSAQGSVPTGWKLGRLSDIIELIGGGTPKTAVAEYWNGGIPWFSVVDAPRDSDMFVVSTEKTITQAGLDNSSARLLSPGTTIISARGTVGKCALVATPMAMNQSCYGVQGREGRGNYYTYFTLRNSVDGLKRGSHGSVFDTITRSTFDSMPIVIPPAQLTQVFDRTVSPWINHILANLQQSRTLADIRDTLLPKLLSGEVRVQEANKTVEAALA